MSNIEMNAQTAPPTISRLLSNTENSSRNSLFSDVENEDENFPDEDSFIKLRPEFLANNGNINDKGYNSYKGTGLYHANNGSFETSSSDLGDGGEALHYGAEDEEEDEDLKEDLRLENLPLKKTSRQSYNFMNNFLEKARTSQDTLLATPAPRVASPLRNDLGLNASNEEIGNPRVTKNVHFNAQDYAMDSRPVSAISITSSSVSMSIGNRDDDLSCRFTHGLVGQHDLKNIHSNSSNYGSSVNNNGLVSPVQSRTTNSSLKQRKPHIEDLISNAHQLSSFIDNQLSNVQSENSSSSGGGGGVDNGYLDSDLIPPSSQGSVSNKLPSSLSQAQSSASLSNKSANSNGKKSFYSSGNPSFALSPNSSSYDKLNNNNDDDHDDHSSIKINNSNGELNEFLITYPLHDNLSVTNDPQSNVRDSTFNESLKNSMNIDKAINFNEFNTSMMKDYDIDDAIQLFIDTIAFMLKLNKDTALTDNSKDTNRSFECFHMKGPASIPFSDFIKNRIQPRCEYSAMIYLNSAYLLLNLLTDYNVEQLETHLPIPLNPPEHKQPETLKVVLPLTKNHVHKLIIAVLRISGKLIEDSVHSTSFFAKIVGINRKKLVELEANFLNILLSASKIDQESESKFSGFNWLLINNMKLIEIVNLIN